MIQAVVMVPGLCAETDSGPAEAAAGIATAHHEMHGAANPGTDTRVTVATAPATGHGSDTPPCTMMGHCTAGLPGIGVPASVWAAAAQEPEASGPEWRIHTAAPQHLTPPPRA